MFKRLVKPWLFLTIGFFMFVWFNQVLAQRLDIKRFKQSYEVKSDRVLQVNIEIDAAEAKLRKSPRGQEARLIVSYSEDDFDIYERFDQKRSRLDIEFDKRGWVNKDNDDMEADFRLELPSGVDIDLDAKIKAGQIQIDLGGLSLVGLELTTWAGEVKVEFSEPNRTEMDYLKINTKVGETEIVRLGNARFKEAEINGGIGEMSIDFRGKILSQAVAEVDLDIGETTIYLPDDDVGVKLSVSRFLFLSEVEVPRKLRKSGKYYYSRNYDSAPNVLRIKVSPGLGELTIK